MKAERNCPTKEEQNNLWSKVPKGGPIPRLTDRLTVGRKKNSSTLKHCCERRIVVLIHCLLRTKDCCTYSMSLVLMHGLGEIHHSR
jgi:hypothetical protein